MQELKIKAIDNLELSCLYVKQDMAKANILIIHGMIEHKERYIELINELEKSGFNVIIFDLRGHGESINDEYKLGQIGSIDLMVSDIYQVFSYIKKHNPNIPNYVFSHSMGTLLSREFIKKYSFEIDKLILSGTVAYKPFCYLGVILAKMKSGNKGKNKYSKLLFSFSNDMKTKEDFSWLSYNLDNIKRYTSDPLCSFKFTNFSNYVLFKMTHNLHKHNKKDMHNPNLKIMSISGIDDRTTLHTKGVKDSMKHLLFEGYSNLSYYEYPNMKHEILQEDGKNEVIKDIIKFFEE